jgi:hypothetical protein
MRDVTYLRAVGIEARQRRIATGLVRYRRHSAPRLGTLSASPPHRCPTPASPHSRKPQLVRASWCDPSRRPRHPTPLRPLGPHRSLPQAPPQSRKAPHDPARPAPQPLHEGDIVGLGRRRRRLGSGQLGAQPPQLLLQVVHASAETVALRAQHAHLRAASEGGVRGCRGCVRNSGRWSGEGDGCGTEACTLVTMLASPSSTSPLGADVRPAGPAPARSAPPAVTRPQRGIGPPPRAFLRLPSRSPSTPSPFIHARPISRPPTFCLCPAQAAPATALDTVGGQTWGTQGADTQNSAGRTRHARRGRRRQQTRAAARDPHHASLRRPARLQTMQQRGASEATHIRPSKGPLSTYTQIYIYTYIHICIYMSTCAATCTPSRADPTISQQPCDKPGSRRSPGCDKPATLTG